MEYYMIFKMMIENIYSHREIYITHWLKQRDQLDYGMLITFVHSNVCVCVCVYLTLLTEYNWEGFLK